MIRFGLIGVGAMGTAHLQTLLRMADRVCIAAVASRRKARARPALERLGLGQTPLLTDWKRLCEREDVDAVIVAAPDHLHAEMTCFALERGKHVLCEKPMALNEEDAERMLECSRVSRRLLMIGHVRRFWPCYRAMRDIIHSGAYGAVKSVSMRSHAPLRPAWMLDVNRSGGILLTLGIHDVDAALWFFGEPKNIVGADHLADGYPDAAYRLWEYEDFPLMIDCAREVGVPFHAEFRIRLERAVLVHQTSKNTGLDIFVREGARFMEIPRAQDGLLIQDEYFVDCVENDHAPDACPPLDSANAVRMARKIG